jgi:hypothetical protein
MPRINAAAAGDDMPWIASWIALWSRCGRVVDRIVAAL